MPRPAKILFPALTAAALTQLVTAWLRARRQSAIHGWDGLGLDWLGMDTFSKVPLGNDVVVALGVAGLVALVVEAKGSESNPLRKLMGFLGNPVVMLIALAAMLFLPKFAAQTLRPSPASESPNLLFVMVDTWRADHAGFLGYERDVTPRLDRLTEGAIVFEKAISQASWTKPAVATLMTGQVPSDHGAVSNPRKDVAVRGTALSKRETTFLEVLRAQGWETAAWSANPNIIPARGFGQGSGEFFDAFNDPKRTPEFDPGRGEFQVASLRSWLGERNAQARPFAAYLHLMDPHYPYAAPAPFGGKFAQPGNDFNLTGPVCDDFYNGDKDVGEVTPEDLQHVIDLYDEELAYMDHHVGGLIEDVIRDHPNTVIVLVSDHGEEFLEHGQFGHGIGLWNTLVHVPLAIWAPSLDAGRIATQVPLMDVPSTVLELLGLGSQTPESFEGKSLMALIRGVETKHRPAPMENGGDGRPAWQWRGMSDGITKAVRRELDLENRPAPPLAEWERDLEAPVNFLFDLASDAGEQAPPVAPEDPEVERLFRLMDDRGWYVTPTDVFSQMRAQVIDLGSNIKTLQSLGYADDSDDVEPTERDGLEN